MSEIDRIQTRWKKLTTRMHGTAAYQIFVVRAMRRPSSIVMYLASLIFAVVTFGLLLDAINPVMDLKQMSVITGVVENVRQATRTSCGDSLYLRPSDGHVEKYKVCLGEKEEQAIIGREVTVWSQREISIYGIRDNIYQSQLGDRLVMDYNQIQPHRERYKDQYETRINFTFLLLTLLPLLRVLWVNRRGDPSGSVTKRTD